MAKHRTLGHNSKGKVFQLRNSLLIDLFENIHIRTVYHLFIAIFVGLFVNTTAYDYLKNGEITLGLKLIKLAFGKIEWALLLWIGYFLLTCSTYFLYKLWARKRQLINDRYKCYWDSSWLSLLVFYYIFSFWSSGYLVTQLSLAEASSAVVVAEQTRFLMKIHSFIRENITRVCYKSKSEDKTPSSSFPKFSDFVYFLFAPTLIYRDKYPQKTHIDWNFVWQRFLECIGAVFFLSFVVDRFLNPRLHDFGVRKFSAKEIVLIMLENTISGIFILLATHFLILHSWQNLCGELIRFGDRLFYRDWWTCTSFSEWFRTWNLIVQDWLFVYIYKDFKEHLFMGNSLLSKFAVFAISAVVHEWILTYMFGFFFPLLFVEFLFIGGLLNFVAVPKTNFFNVLFWYAIALGMGSLVTLYTIEYYARKNAPIYNAKLWEVIVPRFVTCDCISW